jgi:predicted nuclease with TOPRIM domain
MSELPDTDSMVHATGVAGIVASALGMLRTMYVSAKEREAADSERKELLSRIEGSNAKLTDLTLRLVELAAKFDKDVALLVRTVDQREEHYRQHERRLDDLESSIEDIHMKLSFQSGVRKADK